MSHFSKGTILGLKFGNVFKFEIRALGPKKIKEELEEKKQRNQQIIIVNDSSSIEKTMEDLDKNNRG